MIWFLGPDILKLSPEMFFIHVKKSDGLSAFEKKVFVLI